MANRTLLQWIDSGGTKTIFGQACDRAANTKLVRIPLDISLVEQGSENYAGIHILEGEISLDLASKISNSLWDTSIEAKTSKPDLYCYAPVNSEGTNSRLCSAPL